MKKIRDLIVFGFAMLIFAPTSYGQMKISDQYPTVDNGLQITRTATSPSPSFSPLGVAPALMFPPCQSPSGLVLLTMATNEEDRSVVKRNPTSDTDTSYQEVGSQTLVVYPLTKDGPAQQPCTVQDAKSSVYEPSPGSLLSAFPRA